eukprot:CAMPEP_0204900086 /NCGR_PEP_ID=MMETSP1397-20131031/2244_1 /ASSEMBLY_ACC=CAM_ASM_000891 /TAXON_ID=49980 /ORGANISM="Climacostomum Climacostomum virens, Strain Stock W-24" /LENGTH=404 /DNA_ID=CAMNT_0052068161 /DNA_START=77 /DNA_END=1291 /DNA_ORIENTATION=-
MRKVIDPPQDIASLQGLITSLFGVSDFTIRYVDEEGDTITISTDNELLLAYHDAHRFGLMSFKFYIEQRDMSDAKSEAARQLELLAASVATLNRKLNESLMIDAPLQPENMPPEEVINQAKKAFKAFKKHSKALKEPKRHKGWKPMKLKKLIRSLVRRETDALIGLEQPTFPEWSGVECDNCGVAPIKGLRYKCAVCDNFDFCDSCERTVNHPHPFIKLKNPTAPVIHVQADISRKDFKNFKKFFTGKKPKARFVDHANLKEGDTVSAGQQIHKIWRVKNIGNETWPVGTTLVFCKGDLKGETTEVPPLAPGEEVEVGTVLRVPEQAGRYYAVWRLSSPCGQRFGDKLHVLLHAEVPEDLSEAFMDKLNIMEGMGFTNRDVNRRSLEETGGDVNLAISKLVSNS